METEPFLDDKTQLLVAIGAAAAAKCQMCFVSLYGKAEEAGVRSEEVRAAVAIATKVATVSAGFMSTFIEETTKGAVSVPSDVGCDGSGSDAAGQSEQQPDGEADSTNKGRCC